ncbi:hypothetical protein ACFSKO_12915 [Kiloniella antarctica]|uniref:DUF4440 domain-containing protein n=2 Tax=Kiloniella antarctica TaxID=1550907 RepID=A0ABW5BKU6_9PROT
MPAHACNEITTVAIQGSDGAELNVKVNDVTLINHKGSHFNIIPADLLLEGENDFKIELMTDDQNATGRAEIFVACAGDFPNEPGENSNVLAELKQKGSGKQETVFQVKDLPKYGYLSASSSSDDGLLEAIDMMRQAAISGDKVGYLDFLEPMMKDMAVMVDAPPAQFIEGMVTELLSGTYEISETEDIEVTKILGGRAYQVVNQKGDGPIKFEQKEDTSHTVLTQAAFWMKTSDGWKVFRQ